MKTQFEKIYVTSLITNKDRQKFIKYQFNELDLDFEFIYGIDFYNFKNIEYPNVYKNANTKEADEAYIYNPNNAKNYGCALTHYNAVLNAYELGYNNVLIIEDDVCFIKNKNLIENHLNNINKDADFIVYDFRGSYEIEEKYKKYMSNNKDQNYLLVDNNDKAYGSAMYAIMNRNAMKLYLDNQRENILQADWVKGFWDPPIIVKKYISTKCIFITQQFCHKIFIEKNYLFEDTWDNLQFRLNNNYDKTLFFMPINYHIHSMY